MWIKDEVTGIQLGERLWSGAVDTWNTICNAGKEEQAMQYIEDMLYEEGGAIDLTSINDFLWFESDTILKDLGLNDLKEEFITINETDCNCLMVDEDIVEYLRKEVENSNSGVITTDLYSIESEIGRELTDDEVEELIRVGQ